MGVTSIPKCRDRAGRSERWAVLALLMAGAFTAGAAPPRIASGAASPPAQMPTPRLVPEMIAMGTFYDGARVRVEGTAPAMSGVVVTIEGTERDEIFDRKGRVGPIWLTVDKIHVQHAPSVFLRFSSAEISSLLDAEEIQKYRLGEAAIMDQVRVLSHCKCSLTDRTRQSGVNDTVPDPAYTRALISDFLKLKEHEGRYEEHPGSVHIVAANAGTNYALEFEWPKNIAPGRYRVTVYACRDRRVVAQSATMLHVEEVGFPAYMAMMASAKPWEYGAVAVLAAVLAGFLTDLITSSLRRRRKSTTKESAD
ncbi:MAG: TIGR02186 family protein [Terracidiphilus sp.]